MARYVLKLAGTNNYLYTVNGNTFIRTTDNPAKAKVYSDSMLEEKRMDIVSEVRKEYNTLIAVVRVL